MEFIEVRDSLTKKAIQDFLQHRNDALFDAAGILYKAFLRVMADDPFSDKSFETQGKLIRALQYLNK